MREVFTAVALEQQRIVFADERIPVPAEVADLVGVSGVDLVRRNELSVPWELFEEGSGRIASFQDEVVSP